MASRQFWIDRIESTKLQIVAYEDAILALTTGGVASYTLNTGQSIQTVTKNNLNSLRVGIDSLLNRLVTLEARVCGGGVTYVRPSW